jgi:hypothetical protein
VPVTLTISHEDKRAIAIVDGKVSLVEGFRAIATLVGEGAFSYAKIIDLTFAPLTQGAKGIRLIAERAASLARFRKPGPLAFVVRSELARDLVELFDQKARVKRPMAVFEDMASATAWLDGLDREQQPPLKQAVS